MATYDDDKNPPILAEAGNTGLKYHSGYVNEEWHDDLYRAFGAGARGVRMYREMYDNEPQIGATFLLIQLIARKVKTWVEPSGDTLEHKLAAKLCESALEDVQGGMSGLMANALSLLPYGWSWCEKVFKVCRGDHPSELFRSKFDDGKIRWRKLAIRAQESLDRWEFDEHGDVTGMYQRAAPRYQLKFIPRSKSLHFRVLVDKNNPEGRSFLRPCYTSYHYKKNLQFAEAVGIYRDIAGYPVMEIPAGCLHPNATTEQKAVRELWEEVVTKVMADEMTGLVVPSELDDQGKPTGYKFRLVSSSGKNQAATDPIIKRYAAWIAMALMAQFIMLGMNSVGSFALADSHTDMFGHGVGAVIDAVLDQLNDDAFPELCKLNGLPRNVSPIIRRGDVETPDLGKIGTFVAAMVSSGALVPDDPLEDHLREVADLPCADRESSRPGAGAIQDPLAGDPLAMTADGLADPTIAAETFEPKAISAPPDGRPVKYMSPQQVAERWGYSSSTIRRMIANKTMPAVRIGSRYRLAEHEVENLELAGQTNPPPEEGVG